MCLQAVIFDLDGVLIDSADAHLLSWQELAAEIGGHITQEQFLSTFGRQNRDVIPSLFEIDDAAEVERLGERKEALYREFIRGNVPACDHAADLVGECAAAGLNVAVGSSGHPLNIAIALQEMRIAHCFDTVVTGHDVTRGKPNPEVFLLAAERMSVKPRSCVVIEDAPAGIAAALAGGMLAVGITTGHSAEALADAHLVVDSLAKLSPSILAELARS